MNTWNCTRAGRSVALALAVVGLACAQTTQLANVWRSPEFEKGSMRKILVVAIAESPTGRRSFEDSFRRELKTRNVEAVASYTLLPSDDRLTKAGLQEVIANKGFDGVIVTRLRKVDKETIVVPAQIDRVPSRGYYGYYHGGWDTIHTPGYTETTTTVVLDTQLYDVDSAEPVWGARSETINPSSIDKAIASVTEELAKRLVTDQIVPD